MFGNFFTVAFRNAWRNKLFSLTNIAGLSVGISTSPVIYLIVSYHSSTLARFPDRGSPRLIGGRRKPRQSFEK
jgi:hypothetical protein